MEFGILGPVEVRRDGRVVEVRGEKPRAVLAVLLLHANEPVSAERLAVALWGEEAPAGAVRTVQVHVSRVRKALDDAGLLATTAAGYRLAVRPGELDAERFEQLVAEGRAALAAQDSRRAAVILRQALGLWRGPALADLADEAFAAREISRLEEQRLVAVEARVEADLACGRHDELVGELQHFVIEHPWRERAQAQLMLALYRSGRQADALDAYKRAREVLVDQLGIEPGSELRQLQRAILAQDLAIAAPPASQDRSTAPPPTIRPGRGGPGLPAPPNRLIGRSDELRTLARYLRAGHARLVTLTGPGGVGKTRLALEAARAAQPDFADGARFVSLAATERAEDVPAELVAALEISLRAGESADEAVKRFVAARNLLLVVDNLEHVLGAAPFIGGLLAAAPAITVLATSREPLNLAAERRFPVPPLAFPQAGTLEHARALDDVPAVALFVERARAHDPDFTGSAGDARPVAELCRRLDGLPLAIELAAARCDLFSPNEILERLDTSLAAVAGGVRDAPARQQSLHATLEWSHNLLSDLEATCFMHFAVFAGGATLAAAETITGGTLETLTGLVTKNLLVRSRTAQNASRVGMLETVRAYAGEHLATAPDRDAIEHRHYRYFLALLQQHGTEQLLFGSGSREHLVLLDAESDNLHAALRWALARDAGNDAMAMLAAIGRYWRTRNRDAELVESSDVALRLADDDIDPATVVKVLCVKARSLRWLRREDEQPQVMTHAEAVARQLGDATILAQTLRMRADQEAMARRLHRCEIYADEALRYAQSAGDPWEYASAAYDKAIVAATIPELRTRVDWAADLLAQSGNLSRLARLLTSAAHTALDLGDPPTAQRYAERAIPITRTLNDPSDWVIVHLSLGYAALFAGDPDRAHSALHEYFKLTSRTGMLPEGDALIALAAIAALRGKDQHAARLIGAAQSHGLSADDVLVEQLHARFLEPAQTRVGPDSWHAAVRAGAALSLDEATAEALNFE